MAAFTLCADDFGLSKSVNDGIIKLVENGRLNAVSCMSVGQHIVEAPHLIKTAKNAQHSVELGLHVTLTEYAPLTDMPSLAPDGNFPSIGSIIVKSHLRRFNLNEISNEIQQQLTTFKDIFGHNPHFIDGHQHVHILPGIRNIVASYGSAKCWVRQCTTPLSSIFKMRTALPRTLLVSTLSQSLKRVLRTKTVPHHKHFFGVNDFSTDEDFSKLMDKWLYHAAKRDSKSLIMCHPGLKSNIDEHSIHDPIRTRRPQEYEYLAGDQFPYDLKKYGLSL